MTEEQEVPCKTHPDAPHGFCRNLSHTYDRYVCECEFWEPPNLNPIARLRSDGLETLTDAEKQEGLNSRRPENVVDFTIPPYTREWIDLDEEEIEDLVIDGGIYDCLTDPYDKLNNGDNHSSVMVDIKRLVNKVITSFKEKNE